MTVIVGKRNLISYNSIIEGISGSRVLRHSTDIPYFRSPPLPKSCIKKLGNVENNSVVQNQKKHRAFMVAWDECLFLIDYLKSVNECSTLNEKSVLLDSGLEEKSSKSVRAVKTAIDKASTGSLQRMQSSKEFDVVLKSVALEENKVKIDVAIKSLAIGANVNRAGESVNPFLQTRSKIMESKDGKKEQIDIAIQKIEIDGNKMNIGVVVKSVKAKEAKSDKPMVQFK